MELPRGVLVEPGAQDQKLLATCVEGLLVEVEVSLEAVILLSLLVQSIVPAPLVDDELFVVVHDVLHLLVLLVVEVCQLLVHEVPEQAHLVSLGLKFLLQEQYAPFGCRAVTAGSRRSLLLISINDLVIVTKTSPSALLVVVFSDFLCNSSALSELAFVGLLGKLFLFEGHILSPCFCVLLKCIKFVTHHLLYFRRMVARVNPILLPLKWDLGSRSPEHTHGWELLLVL